MENDLDLEDGATEEVTSQPLRKPPTTASVTEAVQCPVGGKMARMRSLVALTRQEFVMIRTPLGPTKIALPHLILFGDLWRLWAAKRAIGEGDPGVSVGDLAEVTRRPVGSIRTILHTLIRSNVVRTTRTSIGWAGNRAQYYPTEFGTQVLGIAEMMGPGTSIQVGSTASAWNSRSATEPANIFRHAAFLRGMS